METYPPEAAYETVAKRGCVEREAAQRVLTGKITDDLIAAFTFEKKPVTGLPPIEARHYPPGWNWRERMKNEG